MANSLDRPLGRSETSRPGAPVAEPPGQLPYLGASASGSDAGGTEGSGSLGHRLPKDRPRHPGRAGCRALGVPQVPDSVGVLTSVWLEGLLMLGLRGPVPAAGAAGSGFDSSGAPSMVTALALPSLPPPTPRPGITAALVGVWHTGGAYGWQLGRKHGFGFSARVASGRPQ